MKKAALIILFTAVLIPTTTSADYLAWGTQLTWINDEGSTYSESVKTSQQSLAAGLLFKADLSDFFFFRTAFSRSFALNEGKSGNTGSLPDSWKLHYYSFNFHTAITFPIQESGRLYIGTGITMFKAGGKAETTESFNISEKKYGYSFILGIQAKIFEPLSLYVELEQLQANPVYTEDYKLDLSGPRINFGFLYYFARDRL